MAHTMNLPVEAVQREALSWPERARSVVIVDAESYTHAGELLTGIKALRKRVSEVHDPNIKRWLEGHRASLKEKADTEAPLNDAERVIKAAMVAWDTEQERVRREEQRRADGAARRREEDERLARAAALEAEGRAYGDAGMMAEAEALLDEPPPVVVAAPIAKATPKVAGISYRTTYAAQIVDLAALVRFVAANPSHLSLLSANMTALNAQARSLKSHLRIPGVRVVETRDVAARAQ